MHYFVWIWNIPWHLCLKAVLHLKVGLVGYFVLYFQILNNHHQSCQISKPNEDHDGGNEEKQKEAGQKASKDMNLEMF